MLSLVIYLDLFSFCIPSLLGLVMMGQNLAAAHHQGCRGGACAVPSKDEAGTDVYGRSELHRACWHGDIPRLKQLLEEDACDINGTSSPSSHHWRPHPYQQTHLFFPVVVKQQGPTRAAARPVIMPSTEATWSASSSCWQRALLSSGR